MSLEPGAGHFLFRQRRKPERFCLRPSIGEALSNDALGKLIGALAIVDAKRNTVVVAEVEFREIVVRMICGAMLMRAAHVLQNKTFRRNRIYAR
jgi:hypothetical protein